MVSFVDASRQGVRQGLTQSLVSNLGPQTTYPVPEGILNHNGMNTVAVTLWALNDNGAKLGGFRLQPMMPVLSAYRKPALSPQPAWRKREGAY